MIIPRLTDTKSTISLSAPERKVKTIIGFCFRLTSFDLFPFEIGEWIGNEIKQNVTLLQLSHKKVFAVRGLKKFLNIFFKFFEITEASLSEGSRLSSRFFEMLNRELDCRFLSDFTGASDFFALIFLKLGSELSNFRFNSINILNTACKQCLKVLPLEAHPSEIES